MGSQPTSPIPATKKHFVLAATAVATGTSLIAAVAPAGTRIGGGSDGAETGHAMSRSNRESGDAMPPQGPSPALFFDTMSAYQRTEALRAAIELDLFSQVAAG